MSACADPASEPTRITDEELFAALDLTRPGLEQVRQAVEGADFPAATRAWAHYVRGRTRPTLHFSRATWAAFVRQDSPQLVAPIIAGAEDVARHKLTNATVTIPVAEGVIDWLHNPTRDTAWVGAVGTPWYLEPVGRAYLLTGDERYAKAFVWFFEQWYDNQDAMREDQGGMGFDPLYHAYYPGVRLRIFLDNYYCCAASQALTPALHLKMLKQVLGSCAWLYAHNRGYAKGNQQVAAVVGLGLAGLFLPEFRDADRWLDLAETRMREHLQRDFFADGGHKELCTQYHKTCLRDMAFVALTARANGRSSLFGDSEARPLLERAIAWLGALVMPTGETPPLHSAVFSNDWAVYLRMGARHFGRPDFRWLADRVWSHGLVPNQKAPFAHSNYLIAEDTSDGGHPMPAPERPALTGINLEQSGFAVMRTGWEEDDRYLVFQYGRANTGHAYPGALHFLLAMNGEVVATGPGSPRSYRHPAYRYCRSTAAHNVVSIDLASHPAVGGIAPGGRLHTYADLPGAWYVRGSHEGYKQSKGAAVSRQLLVIKDGPLLVIDRVRGGEGRKACWSLHTPLAVAPGPGRTFRLSGRRSYILAPAFADEIVQTKREERWMAVLPRDCQPDDCGAPVQVVRYVKPIAADGARFCVALFEGDGQLAPVDEDALRLTTGDRGYLVLPGGETTPVEAAGVTAEAECACVEYTAGRPVRAWVINGKALEVDGAQWHSSPEPASVELAPPRR